MLPPTVLRVRDAAHTQSEYVKLLYNFVYEFIQSARPIQPPQSSGQIAVDMQPFAPPAGDRARVPAQMGGNIYNARLPAARRLPPAGCPPIVYFPTD